MRDLLRFPVSSDTFKILDLFRDREPAVSVRALAYQSLAHANAEVALEYIDNEAVLDPNVGRNTPPGRDSDFSCAKVFFGFLFAPFEFHSPGRRGVERPCGDFKARMHVERYEFPRAVG